MELREQGTVALHATFEESRGVEDVSKAEPIWIASLVASAGDLSPGDARPPPTPGPEGTRLRTFLSAWAAHVAPRPLVLFLDEVDSIVGPAMVSS